MPIKVLIFVAVLAITTGCSHNPMVLSMGKRFQAGTTPGSADFGLSYTDGLAVLDVPRENSSWEMEINDATGLQWDATTSALKGVKKITRKTGIQITGYLIDLAKRSPEAAKAYIEQAASIQKVDGVKLSPQLVTLPLDQSNGNTITKTLLNILKGKAAADTTETVPEGLNMSLADWKMLKAAYIECPECLALTDAELKALKEATGR